jgi:ArsR family transcriptional regulator
MDVQTVSAARMASGAADAAGLMKALSNEHRLLILCHLIDAAEMPVGDLVAILGLSQSALSQHLAKLREQQLVTFRREGQTLFYRVCDARAACVLELLQEVFCPTPEGEDSWKFPMACRTPARDEDSKGD